MDAGQFEPPESYTPSQYASGGGSHSMGSGSVEGSLSGGDYSRILESEEGWDLEFVPNRAEKYDCPICLLVLREPMQTTCGHRFCSACILKWLRESEARCPVDNQPLDESQLFPDNFAKREILALRVKCPNHVAGCDVIVVLKHLQEHHDVCEFSFTPCPLECADLVRRRDIQSHVSSQCPKRQVQCPLCGLAVKADHLQAHTDLCPQATVSCPHCNSQLKRQELPCHVSDHCSRAVVRCAYHFLGCQYRNERVTLGNHFTEAIQMHMLLISQALQFLFSALNINPLGPSSNTLGPTSNPLGPQSSMAVTSPSSIGLHPQEISIGSSSGSSTPSRYSEQQQQQQQQLQQQQLSMVQHLLQQVSLGRPTSGVGTGRGAGVNMLANVPIFSCSLPNTTPRQIMQRTAGSSSSMPNVGQIVPEQHSVGQTMSPTADEEAISEERITYTGSSERLSSGRTREATELSYTSNPSNRRDNENIAPALSIINENQFLSFKSQNELQDESLARHDQQMMQLAHRCEYQEKLIKEMKSRIKSLENAVQDFEGRFNNGLYVWKIKNFVRLRREAEKGETIAIHSASFYSSFYGYKCCIRVNLNGVDSAKGTHLSLFIHFMQGDYDELLDWPFTGRIILTIVDQNPVCEMRHHITETLISKPNLAAFQRPVNPRNHKGFGYMEFIPLSVVDRSMYVRNDTLIIKAQLIPN